MFAKPASSLLFVLLVWLPLISAQAQDTVRSPAFNYRLHCQGCHKADGSGQPDYVPELNGGIAKFLHSNAGRDYLVRVPGVAYSDLNNKDTALLLNWMIYTFDPDHAPAHFIPYTEEEVSRLRNNPISDACAARASVVRQLKDIKQSGLSGCNN